MGTTQYDWAGSYDVIPETENCREILNKGKHALLGVSNGNSYFSRSRMSSLFSWAASTFEAVDVIVADKHIDDVLRAQGYDERRARKKAHRETQATFNRVVEAAAESTSHRERITVRRLSDFSDDPAYLAVFADSTARLRENAPAYSVVRSMTRAFLCSRTQDSVREDQVDMAFCYLEAELPFFLDTPRILGVESSVSCYHMRLPLMDVLCGPAAAMRPAPTQAFAVVRPTDEGR
ncbi:tRNA-dependent cyclodipeptide synthase [Bailinhaonella thermotolerans]|uniref:tRNA-dependent cyclodipeptide synthase n=1 Tax=Bailinhaonella thermotolerans TaxID=1070861 RepID=UPI00192A5139|nr:tRNA-dependent cyclodipeptide synthase [Bailinhaonella thermotolerans]